MDEHKDYNMGAPLIPIDLGMEEPKKGDLAVTAVEFSFALIA